MAVIRPLEADRWRQSMREEGLADATIAKRVKTARQIFRRGVKWRMLADNPLADLKAGSRANRARMHFVSRDEASRVLDAAPDAEWRLLIALSRFGGLRVPSEALALRWQDVDWDRSRLAVHASKTEHHADGGERSVPIFPEIRPHLQAVFDAAPEGAVYVIGRYRAGANVNPQLRRIIRRAGLAPWPRTWHNMRASRQTELAAAFPLHTVCAWLGNTKAIAAGHYLQVTDADWTRAVAEQGGAECGAPAAQNAAQHPPAPVRKDSHPQPQPPVNAGVVREDAALCGAVPDERMTPRGFEPRFPG